MRDSMKPCRSLAASYSAFSLKSPWARASAMASMTRGRSTLRRRSNSALRASYPFFVIGVGMDALLDVDPMILLERKDRQILFGDGFHAQDGGHRTSHGREIRDV